VLDDGFAAIATAQRAARPEGTPVVVVEKLGGSGVGLVKSPNDALARQQRLIAGKTPVMGLFQERNSPDELAQGELGSAGLPGNCHDCRWRPAFWGGDQVMRVF
jgi:hypothetical protein